MKKTVLNLGIALLMATAVACGKKEEQKQEDAKTDTAKTAEKTETKTDEPKRSEEPEKLADYEVKCTEINAVSKLVFEGKEMDTKNINKAYAFNFGGTSQYIYLTNFEPDMKMLESGNINNSKLQSGQIIVKLEFNRRNNKAGKSLITTLAPYNRVITSDANSESENSVLAYVYMQGKSYGNKFLGSGMLSAVTTKAVCGKAEMKGENDDKFQMSCTFNTANTLK